jgi:hypothetical protein
LEAKRGRRLMNIEAHSISTASEVVAGIENIYMAQGNREKLAYRKGFEAGVNLVIEYWSKDKSKQATLSVSEDIIKMLLEK